MIHFFYLAGYALFAAVALSLFNSGETKERIIYGIKVFAQFLVISLILAWIFYFIPG